MSWKHLEKNPPWLVRLLARRKVKTKVVVAISDEELAIAAGMTVDRVRAISYLRVWDAVPVAEVRAFCLACGFDPFSRVARNRVDCYTNAIRTGRCTGFTYLRKSPWWLTTFKPLIEKMRPHK